MSKTSSLNNQDRTSDEIKKAVQDRYASVVTQRGSCCGPAQGRGPAQGCGSTVTRSDLLEPGRYSADELASLPAEAVDNSLGCGNPLAFAGVREGDTVLDIGSGAGIDVLLASKIVGPSGRVIGLDFTPEMIDKARQNAAAAGASNVEFRLGDAERMPLEDNSVDWIISNCVINLAPDKRRVFSEVARVLKPGGRVSISDIVTSELPEEIRGEIALWTSCIAGAIEENQYLGIMRDAGLVDVEVTSRRYYDEATIRGLLSEVLPGEPDRERAGEMLWRHADAVRSIWSAKVVGRKPG